MRVKSVVLLCALLLMSLVLLYLSMVQNPARRLSQAEAVEDTQQFFSTLQRVHPDLLAKVKVEDYIKLKQQTLDGIAEKLDEDGRIHVNDLAYLLCYAAAFFKDGHTTVVWWRIKPDRSNTRFPSFLLGYDNGRFVVTTSSHYSIQGLEVVSIDGKPVREFLRPILDRISGETLAGKSHLFARKQAFWYSFSDLYGSAESLTLVLRDGEGKESEHKVGFYRLPETLLAWATQLQELRRQGTQVHFLDSDRIAWFIYPGFRNNEDEKKKIENIFQEIKARGSQDLIIDLRDNGGGSSEMGDRIFSYLHEGKLIQVSKTRIKVSSEILSPAYAKTLERFVKADEARKYSAYLQRKYAGREGMIVDLHGEEEDEEDEPLRRPNAFFSGGVFLLVDNGSFSSASMFAAAFRDYSVGTILGYETGGVPSHFGEMYPFELENSGILCGVSYKQFLNPKPRPGDDEHGVIPDVPMSDKLLRAYQKEDDPVLAFTLDHIKKTRRSP